MTLRVRVPGWATSVAAKLNGRPLSPPSVPAVIEVTRVWRPGDELLISLGMELAQRQAPDNPRVAALTYGPVVLAALTGDAARMPAIDVSSVRQVSASPLSFEARGSFGTPGDARLDAPHPGLRRSPPALHDLLAGRVARAGTAERQPPRARVRSSAAVPGDGGEFGSLRASRGRSGYGRPFEITRPFWVIRLLRVARLLVGIPRLLGDSAAARRDTAPARDMRLLVGIPLPFRIPRLLVGIPRLLVGIPRGSRDTAAVLGNSGGSG